MYQVTVSAIFMQIVSVSHWLVKTGIGAPIVKAIHTSDVTTYILKLRLK